MKSDAKPSVSNVCSTDFSLDSLLTSAGSIRKSGVSFASSGRRSFVIFYNTSHA